MVDSCFQTQHIPGCLSTSQPDIDDVVLAQRRVIALVAVSTSSVTCTIFLLSNQPKSSLCLTFKASSQGPKGDVHGFQACSLLIDITNVLCRCNNAGHGKLPGLACKARLPGFSLDTWQLLGLRPEIVYRTPCHLRKIACTRQMACQTLCSQVD